LVVKNSTSSRFKGRLHLVLDSEHFRILKSSTFACNVPSGQTKRLPFSVQRLKAGADLKISIESSVPGVFKRNLHLPTRAAFPANPSVPLTLDWSGNRLAEGALTVETSGLKIHLRVMDTNIHTVKESFWEASALEFFFARPEEPDAAPVQLVALPAPGKAGVISLPDKRKAAGTRMKVKADKGGYTTEIFLPYASAGILPGKPFLMEMIVRVSALGDAHGKVSSTWQASANPQMEKSRYAKIEI
jgi:hypothetical protein